MARSGTHPDPSGFESLRARGRALAAAAPLVALGLAALGAVRVAGRAVGRAAAGAPSWAEGLGAGLLALAELGLFALLGWGAGQLLRLAAAGIDLMLDRVEAARQTAALIDRQVVPALERLAAARERPPAAPAEVARKSEEAIASLRARLDASRAAGDPEAVLALHDELGRLLDAGPRAELDRQVIGWLMGQIQRRMWAGTVRADVAGLAGRVADRFGHTREGASLRASLPTLRRSAGLCPRCAQPFAGVEDACPSCLVGEPPPAPAHPGRADSAGPPAGQLDGEEASDTVD